MRTKPNISFYQYVLIGDLVKVSHYKDLLVNVFLALYILDPPLTMEIK